MKKLFGHVLLLLVFGCSPPELDADTRDFVSSFTQTKGELRVDHFAAMPRPNRDLAVLLHFSEPMVPLTITHQTKAESFVDINPALAGGWIWLDPHTLIFSPDDSWPEGKDITFTIPSGTPSLLGNVFLKTRVFPFSAQAEKIPAPIQRAFRIVSIQAPKQSTDEQKLVVQSTTALDPQDFLPHVVLTPAVSDFDKSSVRWVAAESAMHLMVSGLQIKTPYTLTLKSTLTDVLGQALGQDVNLAFTTGPMANRLKVSGNFLATITRDEQQVDFRVAGLSPVRARLKKLSGAGDVLRVLNRQGPSALPVSEIREWDEELSWNFPQDGDDHTVSFSFEKIRTDKKPGIWMIVYEAGETQRVLLRQMTSLRLHAHLTPGHMRVWAYPLQSDAPLSGVSVKVLGLDGSVLAQGITDKRGLWQSALTGPGEYLLSAQKGGDVAFLPLAAMEDQSQLAKKDVWVWLRSVSPRYRRQENAVFRVDVRDVAAQPWRALGGEKISAVVFNEQGHSLATLTGFTDESGHAELRYAIPTTVPDGTYIIKLARCGKRSCEDSLPFRVVSEATGEADVPEPESIHEEKKILKSNDDIQVKDSLYGSLDIQDPREAEHIMTDDRPGPAEPRWLTIKIDPPANVSRIGEEVTLAVKVDGINARETYAADILVRAPSGVGASVLYDRTQEPSAISGSFDITVPCLEASREYQVEITLRGSQDGFGQAVQNFHCEETLEISPILPEWLREQDTLETSLNLRNHTTEPVAGSLSLHVGGREEAYLEKKDLHLAPVATRSLPLTLAPERILLQRGSLDLLPLLPENLDLTATLMTGSGATTSIQKSLRLLVTSRMNGWISAEMLTGSLSREMMLDPQSSAGTGKLSIRLGLDVPTVTQDLAEWLATRTPQGISGRIASALTLRLMEQKLIPVSKALPDASRRRQQLVSHLEYLESILLSSRDEGDPRSGPWGLGRETTVLLAELLEATRTFPAVGRLRDSLVSWAEGVAAQAPQGEGDEFKQAVSNRTFALTLLHRMGHEHPEWVAPLTDKAEWLDPVSQAYLAELSYVAKSLRPVHREWQSWLEAMLQNETTSRPFLRDRLGVAQSLVTLSRIDPQSPALGILMRSLLQHETLTNASGSLVPISTLWALTRVQEFHDFKNQNLKLVLKMNNTPVLTAVLSSRRPSEVLSLPVEKLPKRLRLEVEPDVPDQPYMVSTTYLRSVAERDESALITDRGVTLTRWFTDASGNRVDELVKGQMYLYHVGLYVWEDIPAADLTLPVFSGTQISRESSDVSLNSFGDRLALGFSGLQKGWHEKTASFTPVFAGEFFLPGGELISRSDETILARTSSKKIRVKSSPDSGQ